MSEREHYKSGEHPMSRGIHMRKREPKDPSDTHFRISMMKSLIRISAYIALPFNIVAGVVGLVVAEVLGIMEEL